MSNQVPVFFEIQEGQPRRSRAVCKKIFALQTLAVFASIALICIPLFAARHAISVAPTSISFGTQATDTRQQTTLEVKNSGTQDIEIESVSLSGASVFTVTGWKGTVTLTPNESLPLVVAFDPTAQSSYSAELTIHTNTWVEAVVDISGAGITPTVSITPTSAVVKSGEAQQFTATVSPSTGASVTWEVNGITNGDSSVGTISNTGLYTAPGNISSDLTVTITAADGTSHASASVTVEPAATPVSVSISPTSASVPVSQSKQFTATVTGTTNVGVNWLVSGVAGGNSTVGTISSAGLYTAPATVPSGAVAVTAQSTYQPASSASATVTVQAAAVSVSISPTSASVRVSQTQQFTATVTGTTNVGVSWLVSGVAGGNSTVGTISSTGLYTAPSTVPSGEVTITAQSTYQPASSASATVTIAPAYAVLLSWTVSTSTVSGYNIYRGTVSGGPFAKLNSSLQSGTTYTDSTVQAGQTYYYVTTAVDSSGAESAYSNVASAVVP